jgi:hypothetical protein
MPINIVGAKYAIRSLTAAGTTTVTIGTATFVAGDFGATQRMVSLHSSAGAFKGIAWVRRFVSTTVLELENQFVDPATGLYVAQAVGDTVLVSKNSAESAGTGFAVSSIPQQVAVTDLVTFGTAGNQAAVCFYEENTDFHTTNCMQVLGGVVVFGKLISYDGTGAGSFIWSRECNVKPRSDYSGGGAGSIAYNVFATGGTSAHMFFFGGMVGGSFRATNFIGAQASNATNGTFAFFGTRLFYAVMSPGTGGNWASNPERHLLYKTIHESNYQNASLITWGNGVFRGQALAYPQFDAAIPLGMFRASAIAYFGADAGERMIVSDLGRGSLIDGLNGGDYRFTNLITPAVTRVRGSASIPIEMRFSDKYTNLKPGSTVVVRREADGVIADSVVNTASPQFAAAVVQATYSSTGNGAASPTNFFTTFNYAVKCYGFQVVSDTHNTYTYDLGTAGTGTDLKLGGLINQVADTGVTLTETQAQGLASKISVNATTQTITVLQNATLSEVYDYTVAWNCSSAANAVIPALNQYPITHSGARLTAFTNWSMVINSGATLIPDEKYKELELTGTGRVTVNGAITMPYRDADGLRVTVTGLDPEGFGITWYLRHRPTGGSTWTNLSGTGNTALILLADNVYDIQVRAPGYDWTTATLDTSVTLSVSMGLRYQQASDETPQWLKPFDEAVSNIFQFDPVVGQVSVANTSGALITGNFAELYRATQRIMHLPPLVWTWENPIRANAVTQTIVIPTGNPINLYLTADSNDHVRLTCPVVHQATGEPAYDRVRGNAAGYQIILGSPATAESAGLVDNVVRMLGGQTYEEAQASQMVLRGLLDQVQALVEQVKARTDLVPDEPATSAEVLAIGTPLQAEDYTAPATAEDIAVQVELAIINEDDGRQVLDAIAKKIMAEEVTSTVIAQSVRAELAPELARIDAPISSRSTLTAEQIPPGLTAEEVWAYTERELTSAAGMTPEQAEELGEVVANTRATFASVNKLTT